jgi:multicomponent Na+:H+ antiporter subunit G
MTMVGMILIVAGTVISVLAAYGVVDFPSAMSRMHAATKSASLGVSLIAIGSGFLASSLTLIAVGVATGTFLAVTAPIGGHMVGRAAYRAGQSPTLVVDELAGVDPSPLDDSREPAGKLSPGRIAITVVVWMIVWRDVSIGTLVGGALVGTLLESIRTVPATAARLAPLGGLRFLGWYVGQLVITNLEVAWEIITPNNEDIREAIVACPLETDSVTVALIVANAISFAPGTLTIELTGDPFTAYVHVLHFSSAEEVRADVAAIERRVVQAVRLPTPHV